MVDKGNTMNKFKKLQKIYDEKYGSLPDSDEELLEYVIKEYKIDMKKVTEAATMIDSLEWKELEFSLPLIPTPSPRPRVTRNGKHSFVSIAKDNHDFFEKFVSKNADHVFDIICDNGIIHTITKMELDLYAPIPVSSMNKTEIALAQMRKIRPIGNGDWDNLAKTYGDMIQGILIFNDNIIASGRVDKWYSIKPKVDVKISYQEDFDSKYNRRKVCNSKTYKDLIEK